MMTVAPKKSRKKFVNFKEEFEQYLRKQRVNTTYNGIELNTFGWHKELFGIRETLLKK